MVNYAIYVFGQSNAKGSNGPNFRVGNHIVSIRDPDRSVFTSQINNADDVFDFPADTAVGGVESPDPRLLMYSHGNAFFVDANGTTAPAPYVVAPTGQLQQAQVPIQTYVDSMIVDSTGLDMTFCKGLLPLLKPEDTLTIVKVAVGSTGIGINPVNNPLFSWHPQYTGTGTNLYQEFMRVYRDTVDNLGLTPAFLLWHQGEQDVFDKNSNYNADLLLLFQTIRQASGTSQPLPIVIGTMGPFLRDAFETGGPSPNPVHQTHLDFPVFTSNGGTPLDNAAMVDMLDLAALNGFQQVNIDPVVARMLVDGTHYSRNGMRDTGDRYLAAALQLNNVIDFPDGSTPVPGGDDDDTDTDLTALWIVIALILGLALAIGVAAAVYNRNKRRDYEDGRFQQLRDLE